jgi:hypothetical protein
VIIGGLNTFLIIKHSFDTVTSGLKSGLENISIPSSSENPYRSIDEIPNAVVLSGIETNFIISLSGNHEKMVNQLNYNAYVELLKAAKEKYTDNDDIDIADITWVYVGAEEVSSEVGPVRMVKSERFSAVGKVIKYGSPQ